MLRLVMTESASVADPWMDDSKSMPARLLQKDERFGDIEKTRGTGLDAVAVLHEDTGAKELDCDGDFLECSHEEAMGHLPLGGMPDVSFLKSLGGPYLSVWACFGSSLSII